MSVDLETTGLNPKKDKIIEIGAVKVVGGKPVQVFETFVNPGRPIPEEVSKLTHLTDRDLEGAPFIDEAIGKYLEFAGDEPLLGHSVLFDFSFLKRAAVNNGFSYERNGVDTLALSRVYLPELSSRKLTYLCRYFGIAHQPHRALGDALATMELFWLLEKRFGGKDEKLFHPKKLIYHVKKEVPATKAQKEQIIRMLKNYSLPMEYDMDRMTKNEASRYLDLLILQHGRCPKAKKE